MWVLEVEPLRSVGVRFIGGLLGPLVGYLVALNTQNLNADTRFLGAEGGDVLLAMIAYFWPGPGSSSRWPPARPPMVQNEYINIYFTDVYTEAHKDKPAKFVIW